MLLCCGEALIDMIPDATTRGAQGYVPHVGGAIFNTAIGLGRLGHAAGFLTGLSTDLFGQKIEQALHESGVDTAFSLRSDRPTTLAFVALTDGHATYTFYDENTAGRMIAARDLPDLPDHISTLYFGGISLIGEPCGDVYAALAAREADQRVIMIDPNIRTGFIRDEAAYRARLASMLDVADIIKVSDEDLDWIIPGANTLDDKVAELRAGRMPIVIVTKGAEGAIAWFGEEGRVDVPAEHAVVQDTVGAGDTFNSGVLADLAAQDVLHKDRIRKLGAEDLTRALAFGAKVAAITVSRSGANPPWASEL